MFNMQIFLTYRTYDDSANGPKNNNPKTVQIVLWKTVY